jgi:hypothetical protein
LSANAIGADERDMLLSWQPSRRLDAVVRRQEAAGDGDIPEPPVTMPTSRLPEPYGGDGAFAFVSYKRQDLARIAPILEAVSALGVPLWYDAGIPGGAEWDAVIEERLTHCRFVLLFTSTAAVKSKYVRREVKFADARDTPLLSVLLEDTSLGDGMGMLLTQYQMLDARTPDFQKRLRHTVQRLLM